MNDDEKLFVLACRAIAEQVRLSAHAMIRTGLSVEATIAQLHERLDPDFGDFEEMRGVFQAMETFLSIRAPEQELRMAFHEVLRTAAVQFEREANEVEARK